MPYDAIELKRRIRRARKLHGGTKITEISRLTGKSVATVRRWEDLDSPSLPDLLSFVKICYFYGISADWVLFQGGVDAGAKNNLTRVFGHIATHMTEAEKDELADSIVAILRIGALMPSTQKPR